MNAIKRMAAPEGQLTAKVAALEASHVAFRDELKSLAGTVGTLADSFREHSLIVERQIQDLIRATEAAKAPKEVQWMPLLSVAISGVGLVLMIGALVFVPLRWQQARTDKDFEKLETAFYDHQKLKLHPEGEVRINALEAALKERSQLNAAGISQLDERLQRESKMMDDRIALAVSQVKEEFDIVRRDGSPITRERLAVIEDKLRRLEAYDLMTNPKLKVNP